MAFCRAYTTCQIAKSVYFPTTVWWAIVARGACCTSQPLTFKQTSRNISHLPPTTTVSFYSCVRCACDFHKYFYRHNIFALDPASVGRPRALTSSHWQRHGAVRLRIRYTLQPRKIEVISLWLIIRQLFYYLFLEFTRRSIWTICVHCSVCRRGASGSTEMNVRWC